ALLPLPLLVSRVLTLDPDDPVAADHLAFPADWLHRCSNFHAVTLALTRSRPAQDIRTVGGDGNGVLEVRRQPSVAGGPGPAVVLHVDLGPARVDHGLDGQHKALRETHAARPRAVVRHLGVLMQLAADAVSDELANQAESRPLGDVLDRAGDV